MSTVLYRSNRIYCGGHSRLRCPYCLRTYANPAETNSEGIIDRSWLCPDISRQGPGYPPIAALLPSCPSRVLSSIAHNMHPKTVQPLLYNFPLFLLFSSSTNFLKFFLNILPVGLRYQLLFPMEVTYDFGIASIKITPPLSRL